MNERVRIGGGALLLLVASWLCCSYGPWGKLGASRNTASLLASAMTPSPARLAARWGAGKLQLNGALPSSVARARMLTRARELYGADAIEADALRAGAVTRSQEMIEAGWLEAGLSLLSLSQQLGPAGAWMLEADQLTVWGVVPDQTARSRFWQEITAHLPSQVKLNDLITTAAQPLTETQLKIQSELNQLFALGIEFASGKASIATGSALTLTEAAALLNTVPEIKVEIGVHTDNQSETGAAAALSHMRALAIKKFLVMQGVNPDRLTVKGYGATQPIGDNQTAAGRQRNQRVELRVRNA